MTVVIKDVTSRNKSTPGPTMFDVKLVEDERVPEGTWLEYFEAIINTSTGHQREKWIKHGENYGMLHPHQRFLYGTDYGFRPGDAENLRSNFIRCPQIFMVNEKIRETILNGTSIMGAFYTEQPDHKEKSVLAHIWVPEEMRTMKCPFRVADVLYEAGEDLFSRLYDFMMFVWDPRKKHDPSYFFRKHGYTIIERPERTIAVKNINSNTSLTPESLSPYELSLGL